MRVIKFGRHPNNDVVIQNCIVERNHAIKAAPKVETFNTKI